MVCIHSKKEFTHQNVAFTRQKFALKPGNNESTTGSSWEEVWTWVWSWNNYRQTWGFKNPTFLLQEINMFCNVKSLSHVPECCRLTFPFSCWSPQFLTSKIPIVIVFFPMSCWKLFSPISIPVFAISSGLDPPPSAWISRLPGSPWSQCLEVGTLGWATNCSCCCVVLIRLKAAFPCTKW